MLIKMRLVLCGLALILVNGCMTAADHQRNLGSTHEREMTMGVVQKEIRQGMSQASVATALGSPNIVTKDDDGKETWIYDKIASEASYSTSAAGVGILIAGYSESSGAASRTQKTLTVVIKYDKKSNVESVAYHSSKF